MWRRLRAWADLAFVIGATASDLIFESATRETPGYSCTSIGDARILASLNKFTKLALRGTSIAVLFDR
jgi:hypothetical protein